jgi:hypothetical protein
MKVVVVRKEKESNERLISRFNKKVQGSRKILKVKSARYNKKSDTKRQQRAAAIMREKYRTIREKNRFY